MQSLCRKFKSSNSPSYPFQKILVKEQEHFILVNCEVLKHICSKQEHYAFYLAQKLCFWTGIIFIGVIVSVYVCLYVCVCEWLYRLSQKVFDRF